MIFINLLLLDLESEKLYLLTVIENNCLILYFFCLDSMHLYPRLFVGRLGFEVLGVGGGL